MSQPRLTPLVESFYPLNPLTVSEFVTSHEFEDLRLIFHFIPRIRKWATSNEIILSREQISMILSQASRWVFDHPSIFSEWNIRFHDFTSSDSLIFLLSGLLPIDFYLIHIPNRIFIAIFLTGFPPKEQFLPGKSSFLRSRKIFDRTWDQLNESLLKCFHWGVERKLAWSHGFVRPVAALNLYLDRADKR